MHSRRYSPSAMLAVKPQETPCFGSQGGGFLVVVPIRPGFGSAAIDRPERGVYGGWFGDVGKCSDVNFRDLGAAAATIDRWVIDYMVGQ
jgi:hypothetical protein